MNSTDKARWEHGKRKTLGFYRKKLPWKARQFNRKLSLPKYFKDLIGDKKEVTIAEIGSGMFCTIGSTWKKVKVNMYPSDILANKYNQILKDCNITPLIPIEKQDMENLTYSNNFFDIVHCVNALDHTMDILKALKEMYRVCKPGGFIYLRHFFNVAENEGYYGMHMWNIDLTDKGECVIWNKDKKFLLSDLFKKVSSTKKREMEYENDDLVVTIIQKEKFK
jgi:ubiquinone/menaquinone biosynthesis C-methylase UbiE